MKPLIAKPGFYPDITCEQYFAEPCPAPALTNSGIRTLLNACPAKFAFEHPAIGQPEEARASSAAQRLGNVVHRLALDKGDDYAVSPHDEFRSKEAKAWRDETEAKGLIPVKQADFDRAATDTDGEDRVWTQFDLLTPSQANDAAGQGEVDTRVLAEAAMAKARDEYHELYSAELKRLREALRPFADYADPREKVPAGCHITPGSYLAKRQLTMGDCYNAARALNTSQEGEGVATKPGTERGPLYHKPDFECDTCTTPTTCAMHGRCMPIFGQNGPE